MKNNIQQAAEIIGTSRHLVVLTGAGISKESSIPTFREKGTGIWAEYDPMVVASPEGFMRDPAASWRWHSHLRELAAAAQPNPGHVALADLEVILPEVVVITQNIDGLHDRAGSTDVLPIHGTLQRYKCFFDCLGQPTYIDADDLDAVDPEAGTPLCPYCGRWVRPDVVWFGEMLPAALIDRAMIEVRMADVLLVVGTSGVIQPAASLPYVARRSGTQVIDVNPQRNGITDVVDLWLKGPAGVVLPQVVDAIRLMWEQAGANCGD
jgi:NAD-dependent deacetylase